MLLYQCALIIEVTSYMYSLFLLTASSYQETNDDFINGLLFINMERA